MYTSDALSHAPVATANKSSTALQEEVGCPIAAITSGFPATKHQLEIYHTAQARNPITETPIKSKFGWSEKYKSPSTIKPYWSVREQITLHNELLLFGNRIVVLEELQDNVLEKIHQGHQGILKCRLSACSAKPFPCVYLGLLVTCSNLYETANAFISLDMNYGPLSLTTTSGIPNQEKFVFKLPITTPEQVEANYSSAPSTRAVKS